MAKNIILMCLIFTLFCSGLAIEVGPVQDFCVADSTSMVMPGGLICKNPMLVEANDFYFSGLNVSSNKTTQSGVNVTLVNVTQIPGLNTLGISMARIDYAVNGVNLPHFHPRATEMIVLIQGSLHVGFVTQNQLISKILHTGDVFVFPVGLVHFQRNIGNEIAIALLSLNSQNPGFINMKDVEQALPEQVKFN